MNADVGDGAGSSDDGRDTDRELRQRRDEFSLSLIAETADLFAFIHKMDATMAEFFGGATKVLVDNPDFLTSGTGADVQSLLTAFKSASEGGGVAGGEFAGGDVWDDIADFISKVGDFVKDEKKFLLAIILIILGHPDCVCKCICD